jgi:hypothetical protein
MSSSQNDDERSLSIKVCPQSLTHQMRLILSVEISDDDDSVEGESFP